MAGLASTGLEATPVRDILPRAAPAPAHWWKLVAVGMAEAGDHLRAQGPGQVQGSADGGFAERRHRPGAQAERVGGKQHRLARSPYVDVQSATAGREAVLRRFEDVAAYDDRRGWVLKHAWGDHAQHA